MTIGSPTRTTRRLCGVIPLVLLGACLLAPPVARAQTAGEIIAASIAASGGEDAIARVENFTSKGQVAVESPFFGTLEGTIERLMTMETTQAQAVRDLRAAMRTARDG